MDGSLLRFRIHQLRVFVPGRSLPRLPNARLQFLHSPKQPIYHASLVVDFCLENCIMAWRLIMVTSAPD